MVRSRSTKITDPTRATRAAAWIEKHCRIPDGKLVGKPFTLSSQQREWLTQIYDTPTRTFILSMGRKNGKTAFSAALCLLHLAGPEARANSQLFSAAQSRDQAALLFNLAAKMVRLSPTLSLAVGIRETAKHLYCEALGTEYRALSAEATTAYGLSPVFVVHDELGQVKGPRSELFEALETAQQAHEAPLSIIISTQAPTDADLLSVLIDDALQGNDQRVKVQLYTAPQGMDAFGEEAIRLANPHYDVFINREEVQRQAWEAQRMASREAAYRNLILNQRVEARNPFVSLETWRANGGLPADEIDPALPVYLGLDLSSVADLTALVAVQPVDDRLDVHCTFWLPEEGLAEKSRTDRVPYDVWARDGHLSTTPGKSIEYEWVAECLRGLFDRYRVDAVAFDRWNFRHLQPWLVNAGFSEEELARFQGFGQGFQSMSPALRDLESAMLATKLRHGMHPVLTMCAANATVVTDPAGNRKFTKAKATGRIDGMVALAMAMAMATTRPQTEAEIPAGVVFL
ncbi:MAG: terminase large subunit [Aeromonas veronii]